MQRQWRAPFKELFFDSLLLFLRIIVLSSLISAALSDAIVDCFASNGCPKCTVMFKWTYIFNVILEEKKISILFSEIVEGSSKTEINIQNIVY